MVENDRNQCPSYWAIDPDTWQMWLTVLGPAAASKLAGACMSYFFNYAEPDSFKLTKQARAMFDGERNKLDRRRASALNGAKRGRNKTAESGSSSNVENSGNGKRIAKESKVRPESVADKPAKKSTVVRVSTSANADSRFKAIENRNRNNNPQTPAPSDSARGSGAMSRAEFDALLRGGLGYDSPNAYGIGAQIVAGG